MNRLSPYRTACQSCVRRLLASSCASQSYHGVFTPLFNPRFSSFSKLGGVKPSTPTPEALPIDVLVDEERVPSYQAAAFYPANPGDVLDGRYELLAKLGWGTSSTVWLARDTNPKRWQKSRKFVAIKICTVHSGEQEGDTHEVDMTIHMSSVKSQHRGRGILGTAIEGFGLEGPTGPSHVALVFEPMREPFWIFRRRIMGQDKATREMMPLVKVYFQILLEGLDFLHGECHMVHTDLKLDNVMVTFEDESVIEEFVQAQKQHPMARKVVGDRTVYRCHNNFGDIDGMDALRKIIPKLTDFGLAQRMDKPGPHIHPIQPNRCHAPEVLLGTGWSYSADVWNFGILIWNFLAGQTLFQQGDPHEYSPAAHLAEMMALLGPVPPALTQRERHMRRWQWKSPVTNDSGKLCDNAAEFFGGPFFDDDGEFVRKDLIPHERIFPKEVPECIPEEEAELFIKFMKRMLCWLPEERATAKELKDDPWFKA